MTFFDILIKLRRFLRDPVGLIWSDADLMTYWNDAQIEVARKTSILERVESSYYPPQYTFSYCHDWESGYIQGDKYQFGQIDQKTGDVFLFPWESAYWLDTLNATDDGSRFTHPWETVYITPADVVAIPLHAKFDKMRFIAFDNLQIDPINEGDLAAQDRFYRTHTGYPVKNYYRPDDYSNQIILYPRPSTIDWQGQDNTERLSDTGGIVYGSEAWLDFANIGINVDIIDSANALFSVYYAVPNEIENNGDTSDFPDWLLKYIMYATLERSFGAHTDGFMIDLRDYWKQRKEIGIQAIQRFKRKRLTDRDYRLGGSNGTKTKTRLRLPEHYPATYP
jgi:hypothetical protein